MGKPHGIRIPDAIWQAFKHLFEKGEAGPLAGYKDVTAAAMGMFVWTAFHPQKHVLAPQLARLKWVDRTLCYNFIAWARLRDMDLGALLPRPATAEDVLTMAKRWWAGDSVMEEFREPPEDNPKSPTKK